MVKVLKLRMTLFETLIIFPTMPAAIYTMSLTNDAWLDVLYWVYVAISH